ncbi:MAG: Tol-Pal system beta propeller repeat protein TolB [Chlorobiaceae bacterium]|nr:Tol-Pal system beta propeller repeat protein TolB [Chlorobiaceae bacterium]
MLFSRHAVPGIMIVLCALFFIPRHLTAAEIAGDYISIRKEGTGKITLVLNKPDAQGKKESGWAQSLNTIVHDGLDFTKIFTLISPPLNVKESGDQKNSVINFGALNSIGAEIYAGGTVSKKSGMINLDVEVFETASAKPLMKKTYTGKEEQLRSMGHAFCEDLIELLTGKKSVFGSRIVFVSNKTGFKEIYECDFDGQGLEQLTSTRSISLTPTLSPDGHYLAYTDFTSGRPALYIKNLSDKKTSAASKSGVSIAPGWRNNSEVATTLSFEGNQNIYLVKPDGSLSRRVTNNRGIDVSPTFSPDGSKMAFVSSRNGSPQIFIQDIQSGEARRLTFSGRYNTQPSWSPAGDKIAYSTMQGRGEIDLFVINVDGSGLQQLTRNSGENEHPSWSPNGEMIVFSSNRQGKKKLFIMNSSGENQRRLLQGEGEEMQPSWSLFRK